MVIKDMCVSEILFMQLSSKNTYWYPMMQIYLGHYLVILNIDLLYIYGTEDMHSYENITSCI